MRPQPLTWLRRRAARLSFQLRRLAHFPRWLNPMRVKGTTNRSLVRAGAHDFHRGFNLVTREGTTHADASGERRDQAKLAAPFDRTTWGMNAMANEPLQRSICFATLLLAVVLAGCASVPKPPPVTVQEIVQMSGQGVDASSMIAKMREAGTVYRLSGSKLAALRTEGVPDPVLDYMLQTYLRVERERQLQECTLGPPYFPVDE